MWDGAFNLWDLGGLPTADGLTVPKKVFRSGRREYLTSAGWNDARRDGLSMIVDLRNDGERDHQGSDPVVDSNVADEIEIVSAPTEAPDDPEFILVCGPWLDHPRSYADNVRLYPSRFKVVFQAIARSRGPVLIHCAGGRDRTGLVVAMLLRAAGVSPEVIADDYERAFRGAHDYQKRHPERSGEPFYSDEEIHERVAQRRAALIDWIGKFDVDSYLRDAGLSLDERVRLRELLRAG